MEQLTAKYESLRPKINNRHRRHLNLNSYHKLPNRKDVPTSLNISFNEKYEDDNGKVHRFIYPSLVTWLGCLFCSLYGMTFAAYKDQIPNNIPFKERFRLGVLFTLNYLPTTYALLFISYPLQVIAKNTRYILVVVVGAFFSRVQKSK